MLPFPSLEALMTAGPLDPQSRGADALGRPGPAGPGPARPGGDGAGRVTGPTGPGAEEPWWEPPDREPTDAELHGAWPDPFAGPPDPRSWLLRQAEAEVDGDGDG